ncbi:MAG TPA: HD domain-containing phosphohydrolase [Solirubrobacteraceae bacterium]|nr:HD domain-containing phosphohydrolase [Solirubrobacteraceae bacterium]
MTAGDDIRSDHAAERLLEESWEARSRGVDRRELLTELVAGVLFGLGAVALMLVPGALSGFDVATAVVLVALYTLVSRVEFPVGAGYVFPSQLVLVPMLVLLPPATVPLLVAGGLVLARLTDLVLRRGSALRLLFAIPDAWHALGPALVLVIAGAPQIDLANLPLLGVALLCGCLFDAASATLREAAARGIAPHLQIQVFVHVLAVDACLAPIGFLAGHAAVHHLAAVLLVLPLAGLLMLLARDRRERIEQAQSRLQLAIRERSRLQSAVRRMGDAFAAKLDIEALVDIMLRGSIEALDADTGCLRLLGRAPRLVPDDAPGDLRRALDAAAEAATASGRPEHAHDPAGWALALPFRVGESEGVRGALAIARRERPFQDDEVALLTELVAKGRTAAADILGHHALREQAISDPLTGLGNRRKMAEHLGEWFATPDERSPLLLMLFDLDGFKSYNDTFGHPAGDALLAHLGMKLAASVAPYGEAYRLGGDEFCAVVTVEEERLEEVMAGAALALCERGEEFSISASHGVVLLPHEAATLEQALQLADQRMYSHKHGRSGAREQARDVLMRTMQARQPDLREHSSEVADLAVAVARRLGMDGEEIDEIARAAELHDVGKVGIPDVILDKPAGLDATEWELMYQHTILGERILNAAPALRPVARIVRSTHERWDGRGYPDGLRGDEIPLAARVVAVCDAYDAMTTERAYSAAVGHEAACQELRDKAGSQFDPHVVAAFMAEVAKRAAPAPEAQDMEVPVQLLADRVRTLLGSAKLAPCLPSPAASTGGDETMTTPVASHPAST